MAKYILTEEGHQKLVAERDELKNKRRQKAVDRLKRARDMGDLSENSEYHAAKEDLAYIEGRLQEVEAILKDIEIIEKDVHTEKVNVGSTVEVQIGGMSSTFTIVGEMEANMMENKLSYQSPIGKALIGAKKGESVKVTTPRGEVEYHIVDVK